MPERLTQHVDLDGLRAERIAGPGPAILFVHGAHAGSWCWRNFLAYFAGCGYDAYALNLRGHYLNPPLPVLGRIRLADYAEDVHAAIEALGREPILVGHSLGAAVAQLVAVRRRLPALVLASAAPLAGVRFRRPDAGPRTGLEVLRALPDVLTGRPLQPSRYLNMHGVLNRVAAERREQLLRQLGPESSTALLEIMRGRYQAALAAAAFPRLVISGDDDRITAIAMQRDIAAYQGADLIELHGHGHAFMLEPGWEHCAQLLHDWLERRLGWRAAG